MNRTIRERPSKARSFCCRTSWPDSLIRLSQRRTQRRRKLPGSTGRGSRPTTAEAVAVLNSQFPWQGAEKRHSGEPASMLAPGAPQSPASRLSVWARAGWREDAHQGVWQNEKKWTFGCARGPRKPLPKPSPLPGARFPWRGAQRRPATRHPAHHKINRQRRMLENIRDRLPAHAPTKDPSVAER